MSADTILQAYRLIFVALIIIASAQVFFTAPVSPHHAVLAAVEIIGALMLISRRTQLIGAAVLLCVFATAQVISASNGQWPTHYLQYAASTLVIVLLSRRRMPA
jgi:hypothetical protein